MLEGSRGLANSAEKAGHETVSPPHVGAEMQAIAVERPVEDGGDPIADMIRGGQHREALTACARTHHTILGRRGFDPPDSRELPSRFISESARRLDHSSGLASLKVRAALSAATASVAASKDVQRQASNFIGSAEVMGASTRAKRHNAERRNESEHFARNGGY